jgi:hypothetical protein
MHIVTAFFNRNDAWVSLDMWCCAPAATSKLERVAGS